ncbi:uncharacterized protein LOC113296700 isoform X1 [Papaver somniferum]|uniref:uncharacterized protein LOC113296700 isoform X1 n=1 Tax=Papaver somniferum TaxID=3469 RepID=UPI000E701842|nr:uncharacterized protein LOC113296700 isoform X1 [Papaver somniferum]
MALITQPSFISISHTNGGVSSFCKSSIFISSKSKNLRNLKFLASSSDSNNDSSEPKSSDNINSGKKEIPLAVRLAMEKAKKYKKTKTIDSSSSIIVPDKEESSGSGNAIGESSGDEYPEEKLSKKGVSRIPSIDFVGLSFSDKKQTRGLPAGLVPMTDSYSDGDLPEVEFIAGDISKFAPKTPLKPELTEEEQDDSDVYKPTVSTWGVFPRPSNISKTYGGGKVIQPGGIQEASRDKAAKDARTKKLVANYKSMAGLIVDPKLKSECEKVFFECKKKKKKSTLKEGDTLMDKGKLQQALPYYEKVMKDMAFQNELHGRAALQWSICQDSLNRSAEARVMYEKLQSHPTVDVRKKAKQLNFGFEAMEMIKFKSTSLPINLGYQNYFDAFVEEKTGSARAADEEEDNIALRQTIPYVIFLLAPLFIVFLLALRKAVSL